jgi:hypothetical protein
MTTDEEMLILLTDAWRKSLASRAKAREEDGPQDRFWDGLMAGLAVGISVVSGLPQEGITMEAAIAGGCEIARARL